MQKKLIALAIAGLSGAAFAQSNVTVYGVADVAFESTKANGATTSNTASDIDGRSRLTSNGSLIGFKGTEDLGNGLKAIFQYETFVEFGTNNTAAGSNTNTLGTQTTGNQTGLFGNRRDSYVGLTGGFGTVMGGYLSLPYRAIARSFDVMPGSTGIGEMGGVFGKAYQSSVTAAGVTTNSSISFLSRVNAVAYATPNFNGFSGVIAYVPSANKSYNNVTNEVTPDGWNLGLNFTTGGLKLAYSYLKLNDIGVGGSAAAPMLQETHKVHLLGAGYDFGQGTSINALYQDFKGDLTSAAPTAAVTGDLRRKSYWLGLKHVMGANEFALAYGKAGKLDGSSSVAGPDQEAKQVSLRYGYNFSKRTQVYGVYSKITNEANAAFNFGTSNTSAVGNGADPQSVGVGIRHTF